MQEDLSRFLLPERTLPQPRSAWGREPDGFRPLRQGWAPPEALLSLLQGAVLQAQGDAPVRVATAEEQALSSFSSTWPTATAS